MDLKSMLNVDASAQRPPRLHTPQSSYDARAISKTPRPESHTSRPASYPPPLQPVNSNTSSAGSYFSAQSPRQTSLNSASPGAGPPSAYTVAQSPGTHPQQQYTLRDIPGAQHPYSASFIPSPSMSVRQPPTPGSTIHYQNHTPVSAHSQIAPPPSFHHSHSHSQSPRGSVPPHNQIHPQSRQISPVAQFHQQQPAAPLGPPGTSYPRSSSSSQRPLSRGHDQHYRQGSYGSIGSTQSRDHGYSGLHPPELPRTDLGQRKQSISEADLMRDRDRSTSISPKTIPNPSPYRQSSSTSITTLRRGSFQSPPKEKQIPSSTVEVKLEAQSTPTSKPSLSSAENSIASRGPSLGPSTTSMPNSQQMPVITSSPASVNVKSSPAPQNSSLKRSASHLSDADNTTEKARKRLRRGDIPIYAQKARKKAIRFGDGSRKVNIKHATPVVTQEMPRGSMPVQVGPVDTPIQHVQPQKAVPKLAANGHPSVQPPPVPGVNLNDHKWEPTIANQKPREDLSFAVANWIFTTIGREEPPSGGALFEIEAKIGEIHDIEEGSRLKLPVTTETVFNRDLWRRTKFESSMNMEQHRLLNQHLNKLTQDAHQNPGRAEVWFEHLRECDEFFELTEDGIKNLNPSIKQWLKPRQAPRVRRTTDKVTGLQKAMIIKSRISDLEIYNPGYDFDYRISISIESPWNGDVKWLTPMKPGEGATRQKDRMSYRHLTNQIDLTQVAYEDSTKLEHELEVEMSTLQLYTELEKLKTADDSRFEDLVRSLLDNTRLLCREATLKR